MKTRNVSTEQVMELYRAGSNALAIAEKLGISRHTAYYHLHKGGVNRHDKVFVSTDEVVALHQSGLHPVEIANKLGCHSCTVYVHLNQAGIYLDGRGNQLFVPKAVQLGEFDPIWAAEFRGFFFADGSAFMLRMEPMKDGQVAKRYISVLAIGVRADEREAIHDIAHRLGGQPYESPGSTRKGYECAPKIRWSVTGWSICREIIEQVLLPGQLPAKKRQDVKLLHEAILARYAMPKQLGNEHREKLHAYYLALKQVKRFQV